MYGVNPCCQRDCNSLKSLKYSNNDLHCTLHIVENLVVEFWARIAKQTNKCQGTLKKCSYINCPHWLLMTEKSQLIRNFPNIRCKKLLVYVLTYFLRQQQAQCHPYLPFFQSVRYLQRKNFWYFIWWTHCQVLRPLDTIKLFVYSNTTSFM